MKFHFNDVALRHTAQSRLPEREGRLLYRSTKGAYKERWFRLQGNLLFYFRTNEFGSISDHDPLGVFVLAKFAVELELMSDRPFVFTIEFQGEEGRKHYFSGQTIQQCHDWMDALQRNSYETVKTKFEALRREVHRLTGKDPVKDNVLATVKQNAKLNPGSLARNAPEIRQTKFYYDSGVSSVGAVTAGNCVLKAKPSRPPEPLKLKLEQSQSSLDLNCQVTLSSTNNLMLEAALVSLSPVDTKTSLEIPSLNQTSLSQSGTSQMPLLPSSIDPKLHVKLGVAEMPSLVQPGNVHVSLSQPNIGQTTNIVPAPNIQAVMNLRQPAVAAMPVLQHEGMLLPFQQPGSMQMTAIRPGFVQAPLMQPGVVHMPVGQFSVNHAQLRQPGMIQSSFIQPEINRIPQTNQIPVLPQQNIDALPLQSNMAAWMQTGISQTSLLSMSNNQLSQMGLLPMTTKQAKAVNDLSLNSMDNLNKNSEFESSMLMGVTGLAGNQPSSVPQSLRQNRNGEKKDVVQPQQSADASNFIPQMTSYQKWEKFED